MKIKDIIKETDTFGTVQSTMGTGNEAKVLITKADGSKVEVPATALTPTDKGMQIDPAALTSELKAGTPITIDNSAGTSSSTAPTTAHEASVGEASEEEKADVVDSPNKPIGGDPTDMFIQDVADREWEKAVRGNEINRIRKLSGL